MRILLFALAMSAACSQSKDSPPRQGSGHVDAFDPEQATRELVNLLATQDFEGVTRRFDTRVSPTKLRAAWQQRLLGAGAFRSATHAEVSLVGDARLVVLTLQFERADVDMQAAWDAAGSLTGVFFLPPASRPPPYAGSFTETEVVVGEWKLSGIVTMPIGSGPFPGVVLVHGAGPHDRDETIGANRPFRDLAMGLASRGIAVVRYDKRTRVHGARMPATFTVQQETIDDAVHAAELLRKTDRVAPSRIFVVGHGLGALVAPRIGMLDPRLAGLVLLAGSTRPIRDILRTQPAYLSGSDALEDLARLDDRSTREDEVVLGAPVAYWRDLLRYDPVATAATLRHVPFLIVHGGRDEQVTDEDFAGWSKIGSRANVTLLRLPELNHLMIRDEHVDVRVIDAIEHFVKR